MRKKTLFLVAGVATLYFQNAYAQEVKDSVKTNDIDQVIITGNSNPKKRIESSIAITTLKSAEIQERALISYNMCRDLLQKVLEEK